VSLWDDLERREAEAQAKLRELDRQRDPLLADLADIRIAKAALKPSELPGLLKLAADDDATASFYKGMTLKQLVLRALKEHFSEGATAQQLLEYFRRAYGRAIERSSLSPQLSRLRDDGHVVLSGKLWMLPDPEQKKPPTREGGGSSVDGDGVGAPRSSLSSSPRDRVEL
jgi:hypothetical protein